jgi:hypothetical protein
MKIKLSSLLITLALITGILAACYPVSGDSEYRTMPLGTGTLAPVILETAPEVTSEIPEETTLPAPETTVDIPDETTAEVIVTTEAETTEEVTEAPPVIITYEYDVIEDKRELGEIGGKKYYAVIRYPALTGIEDTKIQDKINTTVMQHAVFQYENALPNASELISSGSAVSYEITAAEVTYMGNGLLSARSEGMIDYASDTNDVKFAYSIVIDLSTGRDIAPKKIYSDFGSIITLFTSAAVAAIAMIIFQPEIVLTITGEAAASALTSIKAIIIAATSETSVETGNALLNELVATRGMGGMMNTVWLIICAMCFGGVMYGSGMLSSITQIFVRMARRTVSVVGSTVCSGIFFNLTTGDQYISIILTSNLFRRLYDDRHLERRLLSRSVEDSATVTSVLIPWNSCGMAQSTVLGVATLTYLPYCIFNLVSPLMSILMATIGYKIFKTNENGESTDNI